MSRENDNIRSETFMHNAMEGLVTGGINVQTGTPKGRSVSGAELAKKGIGGPIRRAKESILVWLGNKDAEKRKIIIQQLGTPLTVGERQNLRERTTAIWKDDRTFDLPRKQVPIWQRPFRRKWK